MIRLAPHLIFPRPCGNRRGPAGLDAGDRPGSTADAGDGTKTGSGAGSHAVARAANFRGTVRGLARGTILRLEETLRGLKSGHVVTPDNPGTIRRPRPIWRNCAAGGGWSSPCCDFPRELAKSVVCPVAGPMSSRSWGLKSACPLLVPGERGRHPRPANGGRNRPATADVQDSWASDGRLERIDRCAPERRFSDRGDRALQNRGWAVGHGAGAQAF